MRKVTFDIIRCEWTTKNLIDFAKFDNIDISSVELNKSSTKRKLAKIIWDKIKNNPK